MFLCFEICSIKHILCPPHLKLTGACLVVPSGEQLPACLDSNCVGVTAIVSVTHILTSDQILQELKAWTPREVILYFVCFYIIWVNQMKFCRIKIFLVLESITFTSYNKTLVIPKPKCRFSKVFNDFRPVGLTSY